MKRYVLFFLIALAFQPLKAWNIDGLQISLLTVEPRPNEVYTIYGHTALRIYDPTDGKDSVFNYGTFDTSVPNFLLNFVLGKTDYFLSVSSYEYFLYYYYRENSTVIEQILDISPVGKAEILQMLSINLLPENRTYRYDFLFDNCTTRIRDIIENYNGGKLIYPKQTKEVTFRDLIHSCTYPYPWMTFGIDLLIGSGADSLISLRQELFLPMRLKEVLDETYVLTSENEKHPIVISSENVLTSTSESIVSINFWEQPYFYGWMLCVVFLAIVVIGLLKIKRKQEVAFSLLFLVAGIVGFIVAFITLFSEHPCTSPNWNLLWLHPFHLITFSGYFFKKSYRFITCYHLVNLVLLSGLLIGWNWIPQEFNIANIPFILCLGLASGHWLYITKKQKDE
jgi:hypothetical protein